MAKAKNVSNFNLPVILGKDLDTVDDVIAHMDDNIRRFEIKKRDGSPRTIIAPSRDLKYIQKSLYWRIFRRYRPHDAAHGFVHKRGISTNAEHHVGAASLGKIDIKSFFDTISEGHLKNCLFGNKNVCRLCCKYERMLDGKCHPSLYKNKSEKFQFGCEELKAVFIPTYCEKTGYQSLFNRIIKLCTYKGFTVQGFPTSPVIANMTLRGFDKDMIEHCEPLGITYTRYADDLAFSSKTMNAKDLRAAVAAKACRQLWAYGFTANRDKTHFKSKAGRLIVCGVVVNVKKNIPRKAVRLFRAKVHYATVKEAGKTTRRVLARLKGWASYLMSINMEKGKHYMEKLVAFEKEKFA